MLTQKDQLENSEAKNTTDYKLTTHNDLTQRTDHPR